MTQTADVPANVLGDVTVVIPTFDRAERVVEAVRSVLDQTVRPARVVVVDDGSTDDTVARLRALGEPLVEILERAHGGVSAARNAGIAAATTRWIALLDSDDRWLPEKLARQLEEAERSGLPIVHSDEIWIRDGVRVNPKRYHRKRGGRIYRHCLPRCCISPSAVLLERELLTRHGGFDESLPACEDYDLWLRLCARVEVAYVDEPLVVKVGGHDDQLSRTVPALDRYRIRALAKILDEDAASLLLGDDERAATLRTLRKKVRVYGKGARKRGRVDEADALDALLARFDPIEAGPGR